MKISRQKRRRTARRRNRGQEGAHHGCLESEHLVLVHRSSTSACKRVLEIEMKKRASEAVKLRGKPRKYTTLTLVQMDDSAKNDIEYSYFRKAGGEDFAAQTATFLVVGEIEDGREGIHSDGWDGMEWRGRGMAEDEKSGEREESDTMPALQSPGKRSEPPPRQQQQRASRTPLTELARQGAAALDEEQQARRADAANPKNSALGAPASGPSERPKRAERRLRRHWLGVLAAALAAVVGNTPTSKDQGRVGRPREAEVALENGLRTGVPAPPSRSQSRKEHSGCIPHGWRVGAAAAAEEEEGGNGAGNRTPAEVADCAVPRTAAQVDTDPSAAVRRSTRR